MPHNNLRPTSLEVSDYYQSYISQVPGNDFLKVLKENNAEMIDFLSSLPEEKWNFSYEPGKWSIKEVLLHVIDTERIMAYRALRIARNDSTSLPGFKQDDYIPFCNAIERTPGSIIAEYKAVRNATIQLFNYLNEEQLQRIGTASNNPFSARALGFVIAGHQIHHLRVIKERYL